MIENSCRRVEALPDNSLTLKRMNNVIRIPKNKYCCNSCPMIPVKYYG